MPRPSTSAILAIFDPIRLPHTIPGLPTRAASIETISSGVEVPPAITITVTATAGRPICRARLTTPGIRMEPPANSPPKPNTA